MIVLENVFLDFPVMDINSHSLQMTLKNKLGGVFKFKGKERYVRAIDDITFDVNDGERLGILGHNGAGKTTLLRLISGAYYPTSGIVKVNGKISAMTDFTLGMDPNVTGYENIFFRLQFMGYSIADIKKMVPDIVEFSDLGEFINLPARSYSTGMYMRLAFSISTAFEPDILICDEIINAGDISFRDRAENRIQTIMQTSRIVILCTHDLGAIKKNCNRVIVLSKGKIAYDGDTYNGIKFYSENINLV